MVNMKGEPDHQNGNEYGALKEGAALVLTGARLFEIDPDLEGRNGTGTFAFHRIDDGLTAEYFEQDWNEDGTKLSEGNLVCLGVSYFHLASPAGVQCLVLREYLQKDGNLAYRRVGCIVRELLVQPSLWDGSEACRITLI